MRNYLIIAACILLPLGQLYAQNSLGKTDDTGRIVLNVSLEEEMVLVAINHIRDL